jgi:hypothetical protein
MARFPFSFRSGISDNPRLDLALATNFDKAATEDWVSQRLVAKAGLPIIVVDARASTGLGTSTVLGVIRATGASVDYDTAGAVESLVWVVRSDYNPDSSLYKVQVRAVASFIGGASDSGEKWGCGVYRIDAPSDVSGGAIGAGHAVVSAISYTSSAVADDEVVAAASAWSDLGADGFLFLGFRPENAASASVQASARLELRLVLS